MINSFKIPLALLSPALIYCLVGNFRHSRPVILTSLILGFLFVTFPIFVQAEDTADAPRNEFYVAGFIDKGINPNGQLTFSSDPVGIPNTSFSGGVGGGGKIGVFPQFLKGALGAEFEVFHSPIKISSPLTMVNGTPRSVDATFHDTNLFFNILARYPGDFLQPYLGIGAGIAFGKLGGQGQIAGGTGPFSQSVSNDLVGFAGQAIGGIRLNVTTHLFLFTEYKFLFGSANNDCQKDDPCPFHTTLDFQSQYLSAGLGFRF